MAEEKKKAKAAKNELYEVKGDALVRKKKFCPKCEGAFMADHEDRLACGRCGYTEFKSTEKK
jgi:small subunit ribosomal protein S27Ae